MVGLRRWLAFPVMALVALVVGHDLAFIATYGTGFQRALTTTGHPAQWDDAVATVVAVGLALLAISLWQLRRLGLLARRLGSAGSGASGGVAGSPGAARSPAGATAFARSLADLWSRLFLVTIVAFVILENWEHARVGLGLPGLTVLGATRAAPAALWMLAGASLAVALVGSLIRWRRAVLIRRIRAALLRLRRRRPLDTIRPRDAWFLRPSSVVGRGIAVRAPPPPVSLPAA